MRARSKTTGYDIIGTCETIHACTAKVTEDGFSKDHRGGINFDYEGETEVNWDAQTQDKDKNGRRLFWDSEDNQIAEDDIELYEGVEDQDEE